jgi:hypothetical protein
MSCAVSEQAHLRRKDQLDIDKFGASCKTFLIKI